MPRPLGFVRCCIYCGHRTRGPAETTCSQHSDLPRFDPGHPSYFRMRKPRPRMDEVLLAAASTAKGVARANA